MQSCECLKHSVTETHCLIAEFPIEFSARFHSQGNDQIQQIQRAFPTLIQPFLKSLPVSPMPFQPGRRVFFDPCQNQTSYIAR